MLTHCNTLSFPRKEFLSARELFFRGAKFSRVGLLGKKIIYIRLKKKH